MRLIGITFVCLIPCWIDGYEIRAFDSCEGQWHGAKDGELKLAKEHLETLSVLRSSTDSCEYRIIGRGPSVHLLFYLTNSIAYNGDECPGRLTILEVPGLNSTERVVSGTYPNMCVTGILPKKVYVTSGNGLIVRFTIETEEAFSFLDHFTIKFNAFYYGMCGSSTENVMACSYTCFLGISNCSEVVNDCGMIGNTCGIDSITTHASPEETTAGSYTVLYGGIVLLAVFIMSVVFVCIRKSLGRCRKDDTGLSSRRHSDSVHEINRVDFLRDGYSVYRGRENHPLHAPPPDYPSVLRVPEDSSCASLSRSLSTREPARGEILPTPGSHRELSGPNVEVDSINMEPPPSYEQVMASKEKYLVT